MWAATVLALVLSFDQPAATYAMALHPASDARNYLGLPRPVAKARKWTLVSSHFLARPAGVLGLRCR